MKEGEMWITPNTYRKHESESESLYDWRVYRQSVRLGDKPLGTHDK
jgi:hypothetical protein